MINYNPSTGEPLAEIRSTSDLRIAIACARAREAFPAWRDLGRVKRAEYLTKFLDNFRKYKDQVAEWISKDTGKSLNESNAEINECIHMLEYAISSARTPIGTVLASEIAEKDVYTTRKPKGVVGIISPWNFPVAIGAFWNMMPALVEGNTVVWKPSELASSCANMVESIMVNTGFPEGVINVIYGDGAVGGQLVGNREVNHICFTGSAEVGAEIQSKCAMQYKTCSSETGSKSAVIVFNDADLKLAVDASIASAFKLSGQRCVSSGRILIQRSIYKEFCARFVCETNDLSVGNPLIGPPDNLFETPYDMGPLISQDQMERVKTYNKLVRVDTECTVVVEANTWFFNEEMHGSGYFLGPFVYKTEWRDRPFLREEVFGPHVALVPFDDVDDAIRIYNDTPYGLGLGLCTQNMGVVKKVRDECNFGMLYVNGGSIAAESHIPFGGVGKSGNGWKTAAGQFASVTDEISVTTNYADSITWAQGMK